MDKRSKISLIMGAIIMGLLLIGFGSYLMQKPPVKVDKNNESADNKDFFKGEVECADLGQGYVVCVEKSDFRRNADVPLKVGKRLVYGITGDCSGTDTYTVERTEKINDSDYYVVRRDYYCIENKGSRGIVDDTNRVWFNKDTGKVIRYEFDYKFQVQVIEGRVAESIVSDTWDFAPWMLALNDNFEWKERYNDTYTVKGYKNYQVVGREIVNGREAFKVKKTTIVDSKIDSEGYYWIDTQKRIVIKTPTESLISES